MAGMKVSTVIGCPLALVESHPNRVSSSERGLWSPKGAKCLSPGQRPGLNRNKKQSPERAQQRVGATMSPLQGLRFGFYVNPGRCPGLRCHAPLGLKIGQPPLFGRGLAIFAIAIPAFLPGLAWTAEVPPELEQPAERVFSRGEILAMALGSSFTIREERIGTDVARQRVRSAQGIFDPTLDLSHRYYHREGQAGFLSPTDPGVDRTTNESAIGIGGLVAGGGNYGVFLDSGRTAATSAGTIADASASISFVQPLLRGFRRGFEWGSIQLAHNRQFQSDEDYREAVMDVAADVLTAYNDLVFTQRNLDVVQRNEQLARQLLRDNQNRVRRRVMAPMDVLQAESAVALRSGFVLEAEQVLREANNFLLSQIHDDLAPHLDTRLAVLETDVPEFSSRDPLAGLGVALSRRPDYQRSLLNIDLREIELERARNRARPRLDLIGSYGVRGIGTSRSDSFSALSDDGKPFYRAGVEFSVPIPGRSVGADKVAARMQRRRSEVALERHRQQILLILDTATHRLETHWRRLAIAQEATLLARRALDAEEEKLSVGMSSSFVVLRLQEDLGNAERREALTERNYMNALIHYQRESGTILEDYGILVPNAW